MTNKIETSKINAAVDLLIEGDVDLSNALGKNGLIKQQSLKYRRSGKRIFILR